MHGITSYSPCALHQQYKAHLSLSNITQSHWLPVGTCFLKTVIRAMYSVCCVVYDTKPEGMQCFNLFFNNTYGLCTMYIWVCITRYVVKHIYANTLKHKHASTQMHTHNHSNILCWSVDQLSWWDISNYCLFSPMHFLIEIKLINQVE